MNTEREPSIESAYTPTTEDVLSAYTNERWDLTRTHDEAEAESRRWLAAHDAEVARRLPDRDVLARVAGMIRRNCTPSTEAYQRGGDALIYAVADWVENPPEWAVAALLTQPANVDDGLPPGPRHPRLPASYRPVA